MSASSQDCKVWKGSISNRGLTVSDVSFHRECEGERWPWNWQLVCHLTLFSLLIHLYLFHCGGRRVESLKRSLWRLVKWWENGWCQHQVESFPVLVSQFSLAWYYMHAHTHTQLSGPELTIWISSHHYKCSTSARPGSPELFNNQTNGFSWQNEFSSEALCVNLLKL